MARILTLLMASLSALASAQEVSPSDNYESQIAHVRIRYRQEIAKQIHSASVVELVLLRFDDLKEAGPFNDDDSRFPITPFGKTTSIISSKTLSASERRQLLQALATQLEKPVHDGGAFCHYPIHGIRILAKPRDEASEGEAIFTGSFCWVCKNFGFTYPDAAEWLDTSSELQDICNKLLPVPAQERARFNATFGSRSKAEP
ncbi:MAG: hypothetical protein AAF664_14375 [Planctomycetota bacterium]